MTTNKSICPYPFEHSYIGSRYERKLCCISRNLPDEYTKTTNAELWNSQYMRDIRLKMLAGEKIDLCKTCYNFEEQGLYSLREQILDNHNNKEFEERAPSMVDSEGYINTPPRTFDYRTIHCNLQCISCGYIYSSTHINLLDKMWNRKDTFKIDYNYEDNMAEEMMQSILNKECKTIYWAGGEPMSSHIHWKVMDLLYELHTTKPEYNEYLQRLYIHYNTNMTKLYWKNKSIPELLDFFQPTIQGSIDGTHETFEYCRDGGSWDEVSKNWDEYYRLLNKKDQFGIASVLSAPVILDIERWFDFFEKYNPHLYNHKLFVETDRKDSHGNPIGDNLLDIRLYPEHISFPAIDKAISMFEKSKLRNKENTIIILESYKTERNQRKEFFDNPDLLKNVKKQVLYRDKFLVKQKSLGNLLSIISPAAHEWYMEI